MPFKARCTLLMMLFWILILIWWTQRKDQFIHLRDSNQNAVLYPEDDFWRRSDRIQSQLDYRPSNESDGHTYTIYEPHSSGVQKVTLVKDCHVICYVSSFDSHISTADVLLFNTEFMELPAERKKLDQIWILLLLESPPNTVSLVDWNDKINYTSSYRMDSDFVSPYGRYVRRKGNENNTDLFIQKKRAVAWAVSHCFTHNQRLKYAHKLKEHIQVDIIGECGNGRMSQNEFEKALKHDYMFYLAFENSNCREYITEKFWENALKNYAVPIVMGPSKEDYLAVAPPNSFIHIDDFASPGDLAMYLNYLYENRNAYAKYHEWRNEGFIADSSLHCRICNLIQRPRHKTYSDIEKWWHGKKDCLKESRKDYWRFVQ